MVSIGSSRLIFLWCVPRSISTAFGKMMACSNQFKVYGEPYIDIYKKSLISKNYFQQSLVEFSDISNGFLEQSKTQSIFVKDMAYHAEPFISDNLICAARHTFLIRDPRFSIPSLYKMRPEYTDDQPGFEGQYKLFQRISQTTGIKPFVIDAETLKFRAEEVVSDYFKWIKHSLPNNIFSWPKGSRDEWKGRESWHIDAINSEGFEASKKENDFSDLEPKVLDSIKKNIHFYEKLLENVS